jgi:hypothetical protein
MVRPRFETLRAGSYLVQKLKATDANILHDGGDIILLATASGEKISIHLIESALPLYEIKLILRHNAEDDTHTLFVFWCDLLLPHDGAWYEPDEGMEALLSLYRGRIYAYELYGQQVFLFPVYFEGSDKLRHIRHGETIERIFLECQRVDTQAADFFGTWWVTNFVHQPSADWQQRSEQARQSQNDAKVTSTRLEDYYAILGIAADADVVTIKKAYRLLARQYHPDLNPDPGATEKMQQINEAYMRIMAQLLG